MSDLHTALTRPLRSFATATRFLTVLPTFSSAQDDQSYFGAALYYFPVVGLGAGCIAAFSCFILGLFFSDLVSAVLLAILLSSISGFLHMDGLADTADGFLSSRLRQRTLEIMRDSRIGVMGATAVGSILLLKSAAIVSIDEPNLTGGLIVAATAGRVAMVLSMHFLPYARSEEGLGSLFASGSASVSAPLLAVVLLLVTVFLMLPSKLLVTALVFFFLLVMVSVICRKRIGGYTGDTLGCVHELMETGILLGAGTIF